jgi:hypothetical protein
VGSSPTTHTKEYKMQRMELTREQIEKFVEIYQHFHEIQCFNVEHTEDGQIIVSFNLNDVLFIKDPIKDQDPKKFVLDPKLN